jgi:hypothetical protein
VNAVIDDATNEIVYRNYVDISVAVSAPTGLVVPVLRNTEKMNFAVSTDRQTMSYAVPKVLCIVKERSFVLVSSNKYMLRCGVVCPPPVSEHPHVNLCNCPPCISSHRETYARMQILSDVIENGIKYALERFIPSFVDSNYSYSVVNPF